MLEDLLSQGYLYINLFFIFSFLGWLVECIVIRKEKGKFENRGFVTGPLCIVYGFGALLGNLILQPFSHSMVLLFVGGAISATLFEYLTAMIMLHFFAKLWWDYTEKPFNFRGIICLESTIGWGFAAVLIVGFLYTKLFHLLLQMPEETGELMALLLTLLLVVDFGFNLWRTRKETQESEKELYEHH